jgi:hypothetical protein
MQPLGALAQHHKKLIEFRELQCGIPGTPSSDISRPKRKRVVVLKTIVI